MVLRKLVLAAAALLSTGACATGTVVTSGSSPAPLSSAWYQHAAAVKPTVAPAQVAPGAYHPVAAASTGAYLALPTATTTRVSAAPTANCSPRLGPATGIPVAATAGTGAITARWTDLNDPSVLLYRLAAVPNSGSPTTWVTVAATHSCKSLSTTVTGLTKGTNYEIWLDAVHTDTTYGISNVTRETMVGRSLAVTVL